MKTRTNNSSSPLRSPRKLLTGYTFRSPSARTTRRLARLFASALGKAHHGRHATVVGLTGDLGTGKTTFIQASGKALGIRAALTSPTFLIMRRYPLHHPRYTDLFHIDAYRVHHVREVRSLGLAKVFKNPQHLVFVEWAERLAPLLPHHTLWITMEHGKTACERVITFSSTKP